MGKISEHFDLSEFTVSPTATRLGINNTPHQTELNNICLLVENVLEPARRKYGAPIMINSGYRCPELNKVVGGVPTSQHCKGEAADINAGSRDKNKILYNIIRHYFVYDQLIAYPNYDFIHVSFRQNKNRMQTWIKD